MSDQNQKTTTVADDPNFFNGWPMSTPLDIRLGKTVESGINFPPAMGNYQRIGNRIRLD